jgi:O-antigen/teichoic acid export membrane protein
VVVFYVRNYNKLKNWHYDKKLAVMLLKDSWPLILSSILIIIYLRIDQVMIESMVGSAEVGVYSAAVRVAELWYFIPTAVVGSVYPSIVATKAVSDELFYERQQKLYNLMALMAYAVAIPFTFMGGWVIRVLYGAAYARAGGMLQLLIWTSLFVNLGVARSSFLTTMNWTRVQLITIFFGSLINVVLNYFLIPVYGGMGAVVASCIAYWFAAHGACFLIKKMHKTGYMLTRAMLYPRIW